MKTEPMKHQVVGVQRLRENPKHFALAAEQGTGKTWMLLADAENQFADGLIKAVLVIAPKGVHTNWVRREIPKHMSTPVVSDYWVAGAGVRRKQRWERLMREPDNGELTVFAINIDALNTKAGMLFAERFLHVHEAMVIVDESSRIKTGTAGRTKAAIALGKLGVSKRIASGTMIAQSPLDAFYQFEFLFPRGGLLGTSSYRAFVAEFADVLPVDHHLVRHAASKSRRGVAPQMIRRDEATGRPVYKNLDKLQRLMSPHTYRVLKEDCLDLPPKVYQTYYYELEPGQRKIYDVAAQELRYEYESGDIDKYTALTKSTKLQQIVSGYIKTADGLMPTSKENPRLGLLKEVVQDVDGQFIIWAVYRHEIAQIKELLASLEISCVEYHGGVNERDREVAIDMFQSGQATAFLGHAQAAGIGLTLTNASTAFYYSCNFSLELRLQSEDRCHRIGTKKTVSYIDFAAVDTIDEQVAAALQAKESVAEAVMGGL